MNKVTPYLLVMVKAHAPKYDSKVIPGATMEEAKDKLRQLWNKADKPYKAEIVNEKNKSELLYYETKNIPE